MEREIKFRGKRLDNGEWAVGSYLHQYYSTKHGKYVDAIVHFREGSQKRDVVDPETVGQFIGLEDKNGIEICEGDVVYCDSPDHNCNLSVHFGIYSLNRDGERYGWFLKLIGTPFNWDLLLKDVQRGDYTVIGNVHENPELCAK